nr:MAG TPA: DNA-damage-inducible protein D [Caudoviricetes sp.]
MWFESIIVPKFNNVIDKAKDACLNAEENTEDHFLHVGKMVYLVDVKNLILEFVFLDHCNTFTP